MRPTRLSVLAALAVACAAVAYALADAAYGSLPAVPTGAPVPLAVVAAVEAVLAKVVRDRVQHRTGRDGRPPGRPLHPVQVARAAALAKASSPAGALLLGLYGGLFVWAALAADALAAAADEVVVLGLTALASLALVVAALLLERACRVPPRDEDDGPLAPG